MNGYIPSKIVEWRNAAKEPEYQSISVADFAREFDYGTVRTVVWEDGGRKPASYPIGSASKGGGNFV